MRGRADTVDPDGLKDSNIEIQKAGVVYKLPWSGKAKAWKRRYFVVKDGYMMYYNKAPKPGVTSFNTHPRGVLPLGDTTCEEFLPKVKPPPGHYAFRVSHPSFGKGSLVACVDSREGLESWMSVLRDSSRVTWEAAVFGDTLINQLREKASENLEKHRKALEQAKADAAGAMKLKQEREEALKKHAEALEQAELHKKEMEEHEASVQGVSSVKDDTKALLEQKKAEAYKLARTQSNLTKMHQELMKGHATKMMQLEKVKLTAEEMARKKAAADKELAKTVRDANEKLKSASTEVEKAQAIHDKHMADLALAKAERTAMEEKLKEAEESLKNLDNALRKSGVMVDINVSADVKNLRNFFESKAKNMQAEVEELELKIKTKGKIVAPMTEAVIDEVEEEEDEVMPYQSSDDEEAELEVNPELQQQGEALFDAICHGSSHASMPVFMSALESPRTISLTVEQSAELFATLDQDGDGQVSKEEFLDYFQYYSDYLIDVFNSVLPEQLTEAAGGTDWHYLNEEGETIGPYDTELFVSLATMGHINERTYVWNSDMEGWKHLKDVPSLVKNIANEHTKMEGE